MKVSISKAANMVGITRATLYRHIDKKGITVQKDADDNPKIDVSELIRVYGDRVKTSEQPGQAVSKQDVQNNTATSHAAHLSTEVEVLRERLKNMEQGRGESDTDRRREREMLNEQIDMLRERLEKSEEQQKRLTLLLTDTRDEKEKAADESKSVEAERLENMDETMQLLRKQNRRIMYELQQAKNQSFLSRLFGSSKAARNRRKA